MRQLKITREKTVTLSSSFYVCIADENSTDLKIKNVPCRLLGRLKNGGEASFEIPETEACVYVYEKKLSRDYTYDMYRIPAGEEDVALTGRSVFNPATSSSFRFYDNETEEALTNRAEADAKAKKVFVRNRILGLVIGVSVVLLAVFLASLFLRERPETFKIADASVTLTNKFTAESAGESGVEDEYYLYASSRDVICEFFLADPADIKTVDDAENFYALYFGLQNVQRYKREGLTYFTCTEQGTETLLSSVVFMFEKNDTVHMLWFSTLPEDSEKYMTKFMEWAKTVVID